MGHQYDLLIITDATASMGNYLTALQASIPEILALSRLSGLFTRVGLLAYRDYCDRDIVEWSGWDKSSDELLAFATNLSPTGGGDYPEAAKTGMIHAIQKSDYMNKSKDTVVLFYTDAPPHHPHYGGTNFQAEKKAFKPGATDWVTIAFTAKARHIHVFSFVSAGMGDEYSRFYTFLSQVTGGACVTTSDNSQLISRLTIDVLLNWMGAAEPSATPFAHTSRSLAFDTSPLLAANRAKDEKDGNKGYLPGAQLGEMKRVTKQTLDLVRDVPRAEGLDAQFVALGKRFSDTTETEYRALVYTTLHEIISRNVASLTYNAVFGQLWRAVCREQTPEKEEIVQEFGRSVGAIKDAEQRKSMTEWLEQSYDSSAEIEDIIKSASEGCQWMYLDLDAQVEMTRVELLEASRNFHRGVLKKLASIFTHAKILESDVTLTEHQRAIPLGLAPRKIFRLLPHLVVPGTLYSSRASSVMAILALTVGVPFLQTAAATVAAFTRGSWLDLEHPETLSWECATFLLASPDPDMSLTPEEKETYQAMRRYRMLELNLEATLQAQLPWTPQKASGVGDIKDACTRCGIKRSFTIMSNNMHGVCGYCVDIMDGRDPDQKFNAEDFPPCEASQSCWVECSVRTCRAQYVVEDPKNLNVRAKCWYCRNKKDCPWIECSKCTNRIVVPKKYTPTNVKTYVCPACTSGTHSVFEHIDTTPRTLNKENGVKWLGVSEAHLDATFKGFSAFKLYQSHGKEFFLEVTAAPGSPGKKAKAAALIPLTLRDKKVMNSTALLTHLNERVGRGDVARATCALCFDDFMPDRVGPACGRTGCSQSACKSCLDEWYGGNTPGTLLNTRQLGCPFCSRVPIAKIVLRTNPQVGGLKGIKAALDDRAWFYAWCGQCSTARQCIERRCTDGGRLPEIKEFVCNQCEEENTLAAERAAREQRELVALIMRLEAEEAQELTRERARRRLEELRARFVVATGTGKRHTSYTVRECPNEKCGVMVYKEFGCDHITCQCGMHWCWVCAEMFPGGSGVYEHLNRCHGGFYGDLD
ncbi:hypothetical protein BKA62DRAFT_704648 [Auriculariales sp. MPI-PUGE-AT-0066]|nr:hypothetical protein BKA62DRAFT_704648 [Auriculariales sp. MPI-PUGE-AT-0066]